MTANFKSTLWSCDCSCSESLNVLQNVHLVGFFLNDLLLAMISHNDYQAADLNLAVMKKTQPWGLLAAAVGINPFAKLDSFQ